MFCVDIDQGIHKGKMKVARNEKRKKLLGFSFYINIGNFEAILSKNRLFWRCAIVLSSCHSNFMLSIDKLNKQHKIEDV